MDWGPKAGHNVEGSGPDRPPKGLPSMPRTRHLIAIALPLVLLPLLPGELAADPLPDVPRDHPAAQAVARLWRAGIIRGDAHGRFHGERRLTREEAICLAARLSAAANTETVRADIEDVSADLDRWWEHGRGLDLDCPYPPMHWVAREWTYLRQVRPMGTDVLEGWPEPLPTRYDAAVAAAEVLEEIRRVARSGVVSELDQEMSVLGEGMETMPLDWMPPTDEGPEHLHPEGMTPGEMMPPGPPGGGPSEVAPVT